MMSKALYQSRKKLGLPQGTKWVETRIFGLLFKRILQSKLKVILWLINLYGLCGLASVWWSTPFPYFRCVRINAVMPYDVSQQVIIIKGKFNSEGYFHRNLSSPTIKIDHSFDLCCFAASDSFVLRRFSSAAVSLKTIPDIKEGRKVFLFTFSSQLAKWIFSLFTTHLISHAQ